MRALLAGLVLTVALAGTAKADPPPRRAYVVLDRGAAARAGATSDAGNALRIWRALEARGVDTHLLACGVDMGGTTQVRAVSPTRAGLAGLGRQADLSFRGATDPRRALSYVLGDRGTSPVDVILLGPFGPAAGPLPKDDPVVARVIAAWNKQAPDGSRLVAVRTAPAVRERLKGAKGLADKGLLVVGFQSPKVETTPFSALGPADGSPPARLQADVRVLADVLGLDAGVGKAAVLEAKSDVDEDQVERKVTAGLLTFHVARRPQDGRTATLGFERAGGGAVTWLVPPPQPLTFTWETLRPEARLVDARGGAHPVFTAVDAEVGKPEVRVFRLRRARTGPAPAWQVSVPDGQHLPAGLEVKVGPAVQVSPEVDEAPVRVSFRADPAHPIQAQGVLTLRAEGVAQPLRLPYDVRVAPGRVVLEAEIHEEALPLAAHDQLTELRLHPLNHNVPGALQLRGTCDGGQERWLRARVEGEAGSAIWHLDQPLLLEVGKPRRLAFLLAPNAPDELIWPCHVTIRAEPVEGLDLRGEVVVPVRRRLPRLVLDGAPPTYRYQDGTLVASRPFLLKLDPDGGDGDWLLGLLSTPPTLRSPGAAPIGWQAVDRGSGTWQVVPTGEWTGPKPGIFGTRHVKVDLQITWPAGESPGALQIPVVVGPRWGRSGFLLLGLALMALVLALLVMGWMRTPQVSGTLLYTVDGLEGAVGRLDLAPVGRRARAITADERGRLDVAGTGTTVARVRPTRVGGMLEYVDISGSKERRLLVDGVSLRIGRHLVRYVSGRAARAAAAAADGEGADLLGPEYDLESGRIDALDETQE